MDIQTSTRFFEKLFTYSGEILCVIDSKGLIIKINPKWETHLGHQKPETEGNPYNSFVHPEDVEHTAKMLQVALNAKEPITFINRNKHKNGHYVQVEWKAFSEHGNIMLLGDDMGSIESIESAPISLRQFTEILDGINLGLAYVKNGKIIWYNHKLAEMLQAYPEEMKGKHQSNLFKAKSQFEKFFVEAQQRLTEEQNYSGEIEMAGSNGNKIWLYVTGKNMPIQDSGDITVWAIRDITREKKSIQNLKNKEEQLRSITSNIPGTVYQFVVDSKGKFGFNYASDNSRKYLKVDNKDLDTYFERLLAQIPAYEQPRLLDTIKVAVETQSEWHWEGDFMFPDGNKRVLRGDSRPRMLEGNIVFDGVLTDITELKKTELAWRQNETILRATLESIADGVVVISKRGEISHLNKRFKEIFALAGHLTEPFDHELLHKHIKSQIISPDNFQIQRAEENQFVKEKLQLLNGLAVECYYAKLHDESPVDGGVWVFHDITEKVKQQETIFKNQKLLNDSQRVANLGAWEYFVEEDKLIWSEQTYVIYGQKDKQRHLDYNFSMELIHPDDRDKVQNEFQDNLKTGVYKDIEFRILHPEKGVRNVKVVGSIDYNKKKKPYRAYGIIQDITEKKSDEEFLEKLKASVENFQDGIYWVNRKGRFDYVNEGACKMLGYTKEELLQMELFELDPTFTREEFETILAQSKPKEKSKGTILETFHKKKDGSLLPVEIVSNFIGIGEKELSVAYARNISERRKNEEFLKKFKTSAENFRDGIYWINEKAGFDYVNEAACKMLGYTKEELLGLELFDIDPFFPREAFEKIWVEKDPIKRSKGVVLETFHKKKDGSLVPIEIGASIMSFGNRKISIAYARNISERRENEAYLEKFRTSVENFQDGIYWINREARFDYVNEAACKMLGYTKEELMQMDLFGLDPSYKREVFNAIWTENEHKQKVEALILETFHKKKDGSLLPVEILASYMRIGDKGLSISYARDISERKKNEEFLNKFKTSVEFSNDGIFWLNKEAHFEYVNEGACKMLGYTKEELIQLTLFDIALGYPKESYVKNWEPYKKNREDKYFRIESIHKRKDGTIFPVEVTSNRMWFDEKELHITYVRDITERKANEVYLNKFKYSVDFAMDGAYWINKEIGFDYVNQRACEMLGYTHQELIQLKLSDIAQGYDPEKHKKNWDRLVRIRKHEFYYEEGLQKRKDGTLLPVGVASTFIWMDDKAFMISYVKDISERKMHEKELVKRQKMLSETQRISNVGSWELDIANNRLVWSEQTYQLLGLTNHNVQVTLDYFMHFIRPKERGELKKLIKKTLQSKAVESFQCQIVREDKKVLTVIIEGELVLSDKGEPTHIMGAIQDITERVLAIEALRMSEQKLQGIFRVAQVGIGVLQGNVIIDVNPQICTIIGREKEELIGSSLEIFHAGKEEFLKVHDDSIAQIKAKGKSEIETIWTKKGGEKIVVLLSVTPINGNLPHGVLTFTALDITKRKRNEEALEKRVIALTRPLSDVGDIKLEDLFNINELQKIQDAFANATGISSIITDPEGNQITSPSNTSELCQYIRSTKLGDLNCRQAITQLGKKSLSGVAVCPCASSGIWDAAASITVGGVHIANWLIGQVRNENLDNDKIFAYADELKLDKKKYIEKFYNLPELSEEKFKKVADALSVLANEISIKSYQNIQQARFITEQKKAEELILKAKAKAEETGFFLQESQRVGNIGSYRLFIGSDRWESTGTLDKILGIDKAYKRDRQGWVNLIHPDDKERFNQYVQKEVVDRKKSFNYEYRVVRYNDKKTIWVHGIGKLIFDDAGKFTELMGIVQDITERKHIEEARRKMNTILETKVEERTKQLQKVNKELESFAYTISHDLRAPLRHIDGFLTLMYGAMKQLGINEKIENYYTKIMGSSKKMSIMIDELLQFSRLGRMNLNKAEVNLQQLVKEIMEERRPEYVHRDLQWKIGSLPCIQGDIVLLKIALDNLISNAIKYTSKQDKAIVEIGTFEEQPNSICLFVKDNGIGFDMAYANKLFGVFQSLHGPEDFTGIGIGLANVKQIVAKHRGKIRAVGEIGKGASFYITLPKYIQ